MAILAASICTHGGKVLVSRQFRDLSKDRITTLFANFPSLLSSSGSQNTTVEDETVRYVYQPLEEYYVVLLTNKQSNILQDIDTLHLFVSVVSNLLRSVDEKEILANAFELLSAFDEIVTLGFREKLTMSQVQSFLEMDSHEEKIQEIIERNKEIEATEERRRRAKEIQRKELARKNLESQQKHAMRSMMGDPAMNSYDGPPSGPSMGLNAAAAPQEPQPRDHVAPRPVAGRGLQLGKKPAARVPEQRESLLRQEDPRSVAGARDSRQTMRAAASPAPVAASPAPVAASPAPVAASPAPSASAGHDGVLITINEKITAQLSRDGSVSATEVKGDLNLRINRPELARSKIVLNVVNNPAAQYKTHPNVDRGLFTSAGEISLKDKTRPFPSNDQSLGVLRWRALAKAEDASLVPLVFTVWVSINGDVADVNIEYEVTSDYLAAHPGQSSLQNVYVIVPVVSQDVVLKEDADGQVSYAETADGVVFTIANIDFADAQGNFEFSVPVDSEDVLFPMEVKFDSTRTDVTESDLSLAKLSVVDVVSNDDSENPLPFSLHQRVSCDSYTIN